MLQKKKGAAAREEKVEERNRVPSFACGVASWTCMNSSCRCHDFRFSLAGSGSSASNCEKALDRAAWQSVSVGAVRKYVKALLLLFLYVQLTYGYTNVVLFLPPCTPLEPCEASVGLDCAASAIRPEAE